MVSRAKPNNKYSTPLAGGDEGEGEYSLNSFILSSFTPTSVLPRQGGGEMGLSHHEQYCSLNRPLWGRHPSGSAHGPKPPLRRKSVN